MTMDQQCLASDELDALTKRREAVASRQSGGLQQKEHDHVVQEKPLSTLLCSESIRELQNYKIILTCDNFIIARNMVILI